MTVSASVCAGEPVSVSVGSDDSTLDLSQLSPGSSYEVSVISVLGLDESDPLKDLVVTREFPFSSESEPARFSSCNLSRRL